MAKKSRKNRTNEQLPEGMSRKQAKLAARAAERAALMGNPRPFENIDAEADFIAFREFVPAASLPVTVAGAERTISICTVLPGGAAALVREEEFGGDALVAMQTQNRSSDVADDLARALVWARDAKPGETLESVTVEGSPAKDLQVPPLSEVLTDVDVDGLVIHEDFNWWKSQFDRLLADEDFAKLREQRDLFPLSMTGDELEAFVQKQVQDYKALAGEFGLVK